jgi:hypothetical protein
MTELQGWLIVAGVWFLGALLAVELFAIDEKVRAAAGAVRGWWWRTTLGRRLGYRLRLRRQRRLVAQLEARVALLGDAAEALEEPLETAEVTEQLGRSLRRTGHALAQFGTTHALFRARQQLHSMERYPPRRSR